MHTHYTNRPINTQEYNYPFIGRVDRRSAGKRGNMPPGLATLAVLTAAMALAFGIRSIYRPEPDTVEAFAFDFDEQTSETATNATGTAD